MLASAAVGANGRIVVAVPLPAAFSTTLKELEDSQRKYLELSRQRKLLRRTYMGMLLLLTVLALFAATWLALFLSKQVTRPVAALAEATHELSRGRLDYRVAVPAADELGDLVQSFNRMAADLEASGRQVEASSREAAAANVELEQRRQHMETILESIPTGVSLDAERRLIRTNAAFHRIFGGQETRRGSATRSFATGSALHDLFAEEVARELDHLLRKADRMGTASSQMEMALARARLHVAVTVASLEHEGRRLGLRAGVRRPLRPAAGAEAGGLARGGPARGARRQEPAHPHRHLGGAHPPPPGARHAARRGFGRGAAELRGDHRRRGGDGAHPGGRVLHHGPLPCQPAAAGQRQRHRGRRAGHVQWAAGKCSGGDPAWPPTSPT